MFLNARPARVALRIAGGASTLGDATRFSALLTNESYGREVAKQGGNLSALWLSPPTSFPAGPAIRGPQWLRPSSSI